jgi:hypothetical protein
VLEELELLHPKMPSATGQNWEKFKKTYADDEEPEKKITPLTDEFVPPGPIPDGNLTNHQQ